MQALLSRLALPLAAAAAIIAGVVSAAPASAAAPSCVLTASKPTYDTDLALIGRGYFTCAKGTPGGVDDMWTETGVEETNGAASDVLVQGVAGANSISPFRDSDLQVRNNLGARTFIYGIVLMNNGTYYYYGPLLSAWAYCGFGGCVG